MLHKQGDVPRAMQADTHTKGTPYCPGIIHSQVKKEMSYCTQLHKHSERERRKGREKGNERQRETGRDIEKEGGGGGERQGEEGRDGVKREGEGRGGGEKRREEREAGDARFRPSHHVLSLSWKVTNLGG